MTTNKQIKDFEAEMDAATLAEAGAIRSNPSRLQAARQKAKTMAKDAQDRADEMKSIARTRTPLSPTQRKKASEAARKTRERNQRSKTRKPKPVNPLVKGLV